MRPIVEMIDRVIMNVESEEVVKAVRAEVNDFMNPFSMFAY
jgi:glycine/serine hydroxymethyltransferase